MANKRCTIEERRNKMIDKLLAYNIYKVEDKQLYQLTLPELETVYLNYQITYHPHGEMSSIQWNRNN